ncbi:MAG: TonB-dependent receptor [Flavobacteriaceae bacterium]|nr:TonB-dependent receptor [Flavobacteriaceae bacterium]
MNQKFIYVSILALAANASLCAQEKDSLQINQLKEVVVSDTKFEQKRENSGKIIEVITAEDLQKKQGQSLANVLSQVAGVEVNGSQSFSGKNQGVYVRGGRNRQVVIYIDGVPVTDASLINLEYDLRLIPVEQIERIEILKGSSSTLYGTGAAAAVINITLKKSAQDKISGNAYWNIGTLNNQDKSAIDANDFEQGLSFNGTLKKFNYLTMINSKENKNFSEARGKNYEGDSFSRINVIQKFGYKFNDKFALTLFGNYDKFKNTFDNPYGGASSSSDDLNNKSASEQFRAGLNASYKYNKGELLVNSSAATIDRNLAITNTWAGTVDSYNYSSRNANVDIINKYNVLSSLYVLTGVQAQYFDMEQKDAYTNLTNDLAHFNIIDPYVTAVYNSDFGLNVNAGARLNIHSEYGNQVVYNFNPSYKFSNLPVRILSSYSTAYITPSLYQVYGPYGNLDLKPEENATAEAGFETILLNNKFVLNAVAFYRQEKNKVDFFTDINWNSFYANFDNKINAKGVEVNVTYKPIDLFNFKANYTFTQVEDVVGLLIPKHKVNAEIVSQITSRFNSVIGFQYFSNRKDAYYDNDTFATTRINLDAYSLINATLNYNLIKNRLNVFGSVSNIFNEDYVEAIGYNTRGRNFKLGLNFKF